MQPFDFIHNVGKNQHVMKIFTSKQIKEHDQYTILHEPIASIDLMERAATILTDALINQWPGELTFCIVCGAGNNGGDGLAMARMLHKHNYKVIVYLLDASNRSDDNQKNLKKLPSDITKFEIKDTDALLEIPSDAVIIDAIFGTGLSREPESLFAQCIKSINRLSNPVIAIDVPSGLGCEYTPWMYNSEHIVRATHTFTLQHPKLSFFLPESAAYTGTWEVLPIGLHPEFESITSTPYQLIESEMVLAMLPKRKRNAHKGHMGHTLIAAGSNGKIGAAMLSAKAALRAGAGLVTAYIPKCGYTALQSALPEIMVISSDDEKELDGTIYHPMRYQAIGIGPGIGTGKSAALVLKNLIQQYDNPLVIDADAINILAENPTWMSFLHKHSILTPHPGEFERLAGKGNGYERWQRQIELSTRFQIFIVLKGHHTSISTPNGSLYLNYTGNSGMATAGSGDVLTGLITGLLSQMNSSLFACIAGVYLHGLAGDLALNKQSVESLIASDIIDHFGKAFDFIRNHD